MTIDDAIARITETVRTLSPKIGNEAVNFFKDNFRKQGWQGATFQPWPKRKHETKKSKGRPILIQSGAMERGIQVKEATEESTTVGTDGNIPYSRIHNEGGQIVQAARSETFVRNRLKKGARKGRFASGVTTGQGFTFKERIINIPQRQYMGDSPVLRDRIEKIAIEELKKAIQP